MDEDFHEDKGLLDDDPALDYILYEEMEKEKKNPKNNGGCLGVFMMLLFPLAPCIFWFIR